MRKFWLVMTIVALFAAACGSSDSDVVVDASSTNDSSTSDDDGGGSDPADSDDSSQDNAGSDDTGDDDPDDSADDDPDFSGSGSGDFCDTARDFEENDPLGDLDIFDGDEYFDAAEKLWDGVLPQVPDEIRADLETIISGFDQMQALGEEYDYQFMDAAAMEAFDAIDTDPMDAAADRFDAYLEDVCGIDSFVSGSDSDDEFDIDLDDLIDDDFDIDLDDLTDDEITSSAAFISSIFGVDMETATCLVTEFGDISSPDAVDLSTMDAPVCGTTLNEVFQGAG